jgi:hypothetical protein
MSKLRLAIIEDDKPVTLTIKLSSGIHRDLILYAEIMKRETGRPVEPNSLVAPMLKRFMATDRAFTKARRDFQDKDG